MKRLYGERHLNPKHEDPSYDRGLRNNLRELVAESRRLEAKSGDEAAPLTPAGYIPFVLRTN